jgi:cold-inducible RNA-binding protein
LQLASVQSPIMKLYVGNLSFNTTDPDLRDLFAQYGTVDDVYLVTDRGTGRSRGFAFVTMSNAAEGKAAIDALEGKQVDGRNLTVNEARPKEEGGSKGGGRRGGKRNFSGSRW